MRNKILATIEEKRTESKAKERRFSYLSDGLLIWYQILGFAAIFRDCTKGKFQVPRRLIKSAVLRWNSGDTSLSSESSSDSEDSFMELLMVKEHSEY
ncbi:hypothetical protein MKW98_016037 [Papaver atlanticum]|uniref:Uncharacterized protein n=1 Tax=Papaver atlanticum TaxID=357466 RepID=A0AAD4X398_9MAGN|nr:hypothetical protein MKW98_016037 [Papaver atlanticum]